MLSLGPNEKLHSTSQPVAPQVSADPTTYQLLLKQQTQLLNLGLQKQHQQHGLSSSKSLSNSTTAVMDCDNDASNSVEPGSLLLSLLQMCLFDCPFFSDPFCLHSEFDLNLILRLQDLQAKISALTTSKDTLERMCHNSRDEIQDLISRMENISLEVKDLQGEQRVQSKMLEARETQLVSNIIK